MDLKNDFKFTPQPPLASSSKAPGEAPPPSAGAWSPHPVLAPTVPPTGSSATLALPPAVPPQSATDLGPLKDLVGLWKGTGFNVIWRPNNSAGSDHFLELNLTSEVLEFVEIPGDIPNRGLLQGDISMKGVRYLQQIQDLNTGGGLHVEPGIWATVPVTTSPPEQQTVVRMASIPHGTAMLAQGFAVSTDDGPKIDTVSIEPFVIALPNQKISFTESTLATNPAPFRSPPEQIAGITQAMLDNPNSFLSAAVGQKFRRTTQINVSSGPTPVIGGGTANTAFLVGGSAGPNAQAAIVSATFWVELVEGVDGAPDFFQLQYSQTVMLNFAGLSWPHVTVATLKKIDEAAAAPNSRIAASVN